MIPSRMLTALMLLLLTLPAYSNNAASVFGQLPLFKDVQISPDGLRVAYLQELKGKYVIVNRAMADARKEPGVYGLKKGDLRSFSWVGNDHLLVDMSIPYYSRMDNERFTLWRSGLLNVHSNEMTAPFQSRKFSLNIESPSLVSMLPRDPEHILMSHYSADSNRVYRVRLADGSRTQIESGRMNQNFWIADTDGNLILKRDIHRKVEDPVWFYRPAGEEEFSPLTTELEGKDSFFSHYIGGISEDGAYIFYASSSDTEPTKVWRARIEEGRVVDRLVVAQEEGVDVANFLLDRFSGAVIGSSFIDDLSRSTYFDKDMQQIQADLEMTFPGEEVFISSYSSDKSQIVVKVSGSGTGQMYFLYDRAAGKISELANSYPGIQSGSLAKVKRYEYQAGDGLAIHSYLALPSAGSDKPLPLIVMPHGGPYARDDMSFDWQRQFFASQGYAVFQPNFRGSSGYGDTFSNAGLQEWGAKMQTDVDDGVLALIKDGLVDKERICIVGASYGGYAAMMGVITRPDLYKCAVSYAGVSDLAGMYNHAIEQGQGYGGWENSIGSRFASGANNQRSPYFLAAKNTPPILLFYGDKDTVVPPEQSRQMHKQLKKVGNNNSKIVLFKGEDHWFSKQKSRREFLRESLKFVQRAID